MIDVVKRLEYQLGPIAFFGKAPIFDRSTTIQRLLDSLTTDQSSQLSSAQ
jgi:hypothetical protein